MFTYTYIKMYTVYYVSSFTISFFLFHSLTMWRKMVYHRTGEAVTYFRRLREKSEDPDLSGETIQFFRRIQSLSAALRQGAILPEPRRDKYGMAKHSECRGHLSQERYRHLHQRGMFQFFPFAAVMFRLEFSLSFLRISRALSGVVSVCPLILCSICLEVPAEPYVRRDAKH